jgi:hypothetical protein
LFHAVLVSNLSSGVFKIALIRDLKAKRDLVSRALHGALVCASFLLRGRFQAAWQRLSRLVCQNGFGLANFIQAGK